MNRHFPGCQSRTNRLCHFQPACQASIPQFSCTQKLTVKLKQHIKLYFHSISQMAHAGSPKVGHLQSQANSEMFNFLRKKILWKSISK